MPPSCHLPEGLTVRPMTEHDHPATLAFYRTILGPGRFARTAYRIRETAADILTPYCQLVTRSHDIIAAIRFTPIHIGPYSNAVLLGPLAVDQTSQDRGIGRALAADSLRAAQADGIGLVLLVGDLAYYHRLGFSQVPPAHIVMPGPVDPARVLCCRLQAAQTEPAADNPAELPRGLVRAKHRLQLVW